MTLVADIEVVPTVPKFAFGVDAEALSAWVRQRNDHVDVEAVRTPCQDRDSEGWFLYDGYLLPAHSSDSAFVAGWLQGRRTVL